ncbi:MAG: RecX family transcriptional regulator, partial [Bacteroidota bacterium]
QSEYLNTLEKLAKNKDQQLKTNDTAKKKQKIFRYLNGKGYEEDLINKTIENINS